MAKLYPPTIENCVMFKSYIEIPFKHNMAVNPNGCTYALKVKTISTNKEIINLKNGFIKNNKIFFNIESQNESIKYGEYYKIQVAYIDNSTVGYYSSLALARCTSNISSYAFYKDKYLPNKFYLNINRGIEDKSDTLYSYRVWLCKLNAPIESGFTDERTQLDFLNHLNQYSFIIIGDTGTKIININDYNYTNIYKAGFEFHDINFDCTNKYRYFLVAKITTVNGVELKTAPVLIPLQIKNTDLSSEAELVVENNFEYGYIKIQAKGGSGYLSKTDGDIYWPIKDMSNNQIYYDFCVEQGKRYTYTLGKGKFVLNNKIFNVSDSISSEDTENLDLEDF